MNPFRNLFSVPEDVTFGVCFNTEKIRVRLSLIFNVLTFVFESLRRSVVAIRDDHLVFDYNSPDLQPFGV
jgi:hypothetical protein